MQLKLVEGQIQLCLLWAEEFWQGLQERLCANNTLQHPLKEGEAEHYLV